VKLQFRLLDVVFAVCLIALGVSTMLQSEHLTRLQLLWDQQRIEWKTDINGPPITSEELQRRLKNWIKNSEVP